VLAATTEQLGGDGSADLREALAIAHRTGARIITHDAHLLLATTVLDDDVGLTLREREVIDHIATGDTNGQVARELGIAEATVRKHLEHAFRKLQVSTRTGAVARAAELRAQR
jgi:DNA-binding CsgD family transcriptional regulator